MGLNKKGEKVGLPTTDTDGNLLFFKPFKATVVDSLFIRKMVKSPSVDLVKKNTIVNYYKNFRDSQVEKPKETTENKGTSEK